MASLSNDGNSKWRVQVGEGKARKTIRYRGGPDDAERFRRRVEHLALAKSHGEPIDADLVKWLAKLPDAQHARLVRAGLVKPRKDNRQTLKTLLDTFFEHLEVKPITSLGYQSTRAALIERFGADTAIEDIGALAAEQWRKAMKDSGLAEATISKRVQLSRHIFKKAIAWKWISENPFASVRAGSQKNKARQFFITREMADKVMDKCPSLQWQLIFALSRFGGLRCPSETLALKWSDILWDQNRFRVPCSKTEHHEGREERFVPIYPELEPLLLKAHSTAADGDGTIITAYRAGQQNLRTHFRRIVKRAGLVAWPRLFHNLRSSRQTELNEQFPAHVVCTWMGNTEKVAEGHYLQTHDEHFRKAAQKAAQQGVKQSAMEGKPESELQPVTADATPCNNSKGEPVAATGLEPVTRGL